MKRIAPALGVIALGLALAACGPSSSSTPSSSQSAVQSAASALATNTAVQAVKQDITKCVPTGTAAQLSWAHQLHTDTAAHPNGSRQQFFKCVGISQAQEQPFLAAVLSAFESALTSGQLNTHAGRVTFATTTVPGIAVQFITPSPSPSVTK